MKHLKTLGIVLLCATIPHLAHAGIVIENGLSHHHQSEPGGAHEGTIRIANLEDYPIVVKVYVRDYQFSADGTASYGEPGSHVRSNARWVETNVTLVEIAPKQKRNVHYAVTVPRSPELRGTYWSVVMVEGMDSENTDPNSFVSINTVVRYAVQITTDFGNASGEMNFDRPQVERDTTGAGGFWFHIAANNTGETRLEPELVLELFDAAGGSLGIQRLPKRKTYPGTSVRGSFHLKEIPPGTYPGLLLADCGNGDIYGVNLDLKLE